VNRLWLRLSLAFVLVTLIGVVTVTLLVDWSAGSEFRQYVMRRDMMSQGDLMGTLTAFYQRQGNWNGVVDVLAAETRRSLGQGRGMMVGRPAMLLADADYRVIYDERGTRLNSTLDQDERANALPVTVNGCTVGYVLVSSPGRDTLQPAEQAFLDQLRSTLVIAALIAGGVGIALGVAISRGITRPLARLADTARAFAARDWTRRAAATGTREIADVAAAFNEMADELQRSETQRRNLMADIAHDLRSPLTVMQGNLQALLDGVYPLERTEIASLFDETRLLSRLVDDVRELTLAEAGQLPLNIRPVDVAASLRATAAHFALAAEAQNVEIGLDIPGQLPMALADADRLTQVLRNLVTNALRHAPGGQITLSVRAQAPAPGCAGRIRIIVADTGEGIPPEDLPHIFDRFYRGDKSRTRTGGGTGLGLAIAKTWVEAMGGEIGVESQAGSGSRFWFTLPVAADAVPGPSEG
jgi:two-component system OmpR family sensor kinase